MIRWADEIPRVVNCMALEDSEHYDMTYLSSDDHRFPNGLDAGLINFVQAYGYFLHPAIAADLDSLTVWAS